MRLIPSLEALETREAPYGSWAGAVVSYSFAPDGTSWSGGTSTLVSVLNRVRPSWRDDLRRAFSHWAVASGLTFREVPDDGSPFGSAGKAQGDARFGDVRIGGVVSPTSPMTLAWAYGPPPNGTTHAGDLTFNLIHDWASVDLFSVALHELGHSLGDLPHSDDPASVMGKAYKGPVKGLGASDVAAIQAVYGKAHPNPADVFSKFGRAS